MINGRLLSLGIVVFFGSVSCAPYEPPPQYPAGSTGGGTYERLAEIIGQWRNESIPLKVTFYEDGRFLWEQGEVTERGNYSISGDTLIMIVENGARSTYKVVKVDSNQLVLKDKYGSVAYLDRVVEKEKKEIEHTPPPSVMAGRYKSIYGSWFGPYGIKIDLIEGGKFVWSQPDYRQEGEFSVVDEAIVFTVKGNPTRYRIAVFSSDRMIIVDPKGHEIPLVKGQAEDGQVHVQPEVASKRHEVMRIYDSKSIFYIQIPEGWSVSRTREVEYPSDGPVVVSNVEGHEFSVRVFTLVERARKGALKRLKSQLEGMIAVFSSGRKEVVDKVREMNSYEVFSRRMEGQSPDGRFLMRMRMMGIHFEDYVVLGVVVVSYESQLDTIMSDVATSIIDSMNFDIKENKGYSYRLLGLWLEKEDKAGKMTEVIVLSFYSGNRFVYISMDLEEFSKWHAGSSVDLKSLLISSSAQTGSYIVAKKMLILDFGKDKGLRAFSLKFDDKKGGFFLDSMYFIKKGEGK